MSKYEGGRLNLFHPILNNNWIIFADTPDQSYPNKWMVRAVNLQNLSERLVAQNGAEGNSYLPMFFNDAVDGDYLYWTVGVAKSGQLDESLISRMDLKTGKTEVLTRTKADMGIWSLLGASENRLIVEQDTNENNGRGSHIFLFDPPDGQAKQLSSDVTNNLLQFVYPWVVWKTGSQYPNLYKISVHNLQTSQTRLFTLPGEDNSNILGMDGAQIVWTGAIDGANTYYAILILDLVKNMVYVLPSSQQHTLFKDVAIHGGVIAWIRSENSDTNQPILHLEWARIK
jgi:hypothetical protein